MIHKKIVFRPAYDKRNPDPAKNYGIGAAKIIFSTWDDEIGEGAELHVGTGWYLDPSNNDEAPNGYGVFYHKKYPQYEGQNPNSDKCEITGGECYSDGSYTYSDELTRMLIEQGEDAVWAALDDFWRSR